MDKPIRVAMLQCGMVGVKATATVLSGSLTWQWWGDVKDHGHTQSRGPLLGLLLWTSHLYFMGFSFIICNNRQDNPPPKYTPKRPYAESHSLMCRGAFLTLPNRLLPSDTGSDSPEPELALLRSIPLVSVDAPGH